jgi:hypothetical protein
VSSRLLVLAGFAVAVLVMGVYLFIEVHASPAAAQVVPQTQARSHTPAPERDDAPVTPSTEPGHRAPTGPRMGRPLHADELRAAEAPAMPSSDGPALADIPDKSDPRFQMVMGEANKAYDRQDFDEARSIATRVLAKDPTNVRMLRIMVSSHCIEGDSVAAQTYYDKLPQFDRQQMTKRCATYGVTFK